MRPLILLIFIGFSFGLASQVTDTVALLQEQRNQNSLWEAPNGVFYKVEMVESEDNADALPAEVAFRRAMSSSCIDATFTGVVRRKSKTTPHAGNLKKFAKLDLLMAFLPSDSFMVNHDPPIDGLPDGERVLEERRNVLLKKVWLFSLSREEDNDYHLIIGNHENPDSAKIFLNIEVSGLPTDTPANRKAFKALHKVRKDFVKVFGETQCRKTFKFREKGVPMEVKGSLFFDKHHASSGTGSGNLRPATVWEIHPVTSIKWLSL